MRHSEKMPLLTAICLDLPHDAPRAEVTWDALGTEPDLDTTRRIGDDWALDGEALILSVPSLVIPYDTNHLLNPLHKDFHRVEVRSQRPFKFDKRMAL